VQEDSDKILLVRFADDTDAGLYAAAYRLVQLGFIPVRALIGSSHPRFLVNTPGEKKEHLGRAVRYTRPAALYSIVALVGIVVTAPVVPAFFGSEYDGTLPLLIALSPLVLLRSLSLFPLNALMGLGRYGTRFAIIAAAAVLNVGLNLVLIPPLSIWGAVIATMIHRGVLHRPGVGRGGPRPAPARQRGSQPGAAAHTGPRRRSAQPLLGVSRQSPAAVGLLVFGLRGPPVLTP
jgi:O-antigen/teichoic acid export membrane protein